MAPTAPSTFELDVFAVGADVADVREGEGDDLPGVGGIGHHLLVAGHRGVEADLAHRGADVAETAAPDDGAVGQNEDSRRILGLCRRAGGVGHS